MRNKFISALAVLVGTIIGVGFLGIPYVVSKSGFLPGLAYLIFVAVFMMFVNLYLGEISLRTKGNHQLTGYAEIYLGRKGKILMLFSMLFGIYSALVAYLIAEGEVLSFIFSGNESWALIFSLAFWIILSGLTFIGLKALKKYEKISMFLVLAIFLVILIFFFPKIKIDNLSYINTGSIFLPFGVMIFSFLAFSALPEVERILHGQERLMKKVIFVGLLIPFFVYFLFMLVVVGSFGRNVPEIATLILGRGFSVLAVLTMFTAYFSQAIAIRDMFRFDFGMGRFKGWILASLVPLVLFFFVYFFRVASFISMIAIGGVVSGGLAGVLILLMNKRAKKFGDRKPEYSIGISWFTIILMALVFIFAVVAQFVF